MTVGALMVLQIEPLIVGWALGVMTAALVYLRYRRKQ